jgi:hypothetical protein
MNAEREIEALELQLCEADCQITALGSDLRQAQENARKYEDRYFETKAALRNLNCRIHSGCWACGPLCYTVDDAWAQWARVALKPGPQEESSADVLATVLDLIVRDGQGSVFLLNQAQMALIKYREANK